MAEQDTMIANLGRGAVRALPLTRDPDPPDGGLLGRVADRGRIADPVRIRTGPDDR